MNIQNKNKAIQLLNLIKIQITNNQQLSIFYPTLNFNQQKLKYEVISVKNFGKFSKRNCYQLSRLIALLTNCIKRQRIYKKRAIYYQLIKFYKNCYQQLDKDIRTLSFTLQMSRLQLGIISSSKCLISGPIQAIQQNTLINYNTKRVANLYNYGLGPLLKIQGNSVLLVQKQSIMQNIINSNNLNNGCIIVTAKGYPDFSARYLIKNIINIPIFYLGDYDPYGFDILLEYSFGNKNNVMQDFTNKNILYLQISNFINNHQQLFNCQLFQSQILQFTNQDIKKTNQILQSEIFNIQIQGLYKQKLTQWRFIIQQMIINKKKIQLQGIFKCCKIDIVQCLDKLIQQGYYI